MATPIVLRYPLDRTGLDPTNLVINEEHELPNKLTRAIAPRSGPFYTNSVVVVDTVTNQTLVKGTDYHCVEYYEYPSKIFGKEICSVILLVQPNNSLKVKIQYQVVGGEFSYNSHAMAKMIEAIDNDDRPVNWPDIINKLDSYQPAPHLHDIGDTYGWEYIVQALENLRQAILIGDAAHIEEVLAYVDNTASSLDNDITALENLFAQHASNTNNPHQVTKAQVGLGNVPNYSMANSGQAQAGTSTTNFMSPKLVSDVVQSKAINPLNAHINNFSNPHQVTKAQVGLGAVENYAVATTAQAQQGTIDNRYMTPLKTKDAITKIAGDMLNVHTSNHNNPHQVTKTQVGLGNVPNYGMATTSEAYAGTATNKFMSPASVKSAIQAIAGFQLNAHLTDFNNPHQVTKAQVGLGNIPNAITSSRTTNSNAWLLTAKAMTDHIASGDFDYRYVLKTQGTPALQMQISSGKFQVYINGGWRNVWPPEWQ